MQPITRNHLLHGIDHKQAGSKAEMAAALEKILNQIDAAQAFLKKLKNGDEPLTAQSVDEIKAARARARLYTGFLNEAEPHFSSTDFFPLCQEAARKANGTLPNIHRLAEQLLELFSDK